jgi:hypothetical protein
MPAQAYVVEHLLDQVHVLSRGQVSGTAFLDQSIAWPQPLNLQPLVSYIEREHANQNKCVFSSPNFELQNTFGLFLSRSETHLVL